MSLTETEAKDTAKRVLVVENNAAAAMAIRRISEPRGLLLRFAETGADARGWLAIEHFDLAIVDELIPDEPYESLILHLRQAQTPPPKIWFMLSRATLERVGNGARELDALFGPETLPDRWIFKPFGKGELGIVMDWSLSHQAF